MRLRRAIDADIEEVKVRNEIGQFRRRLETTDTTGGSSKEKKGDMWLLEFLTPSCAGHDFWEL